MTFDDWYTNGGFLYHRVDKQDLRDIWQVAQAAERDRAIKILLKHLQDPFSKWEDAVKAAMEEIKGD